MEPLKPKLLYAEASLEMARPAAGKRLDNGIVERKRKETTTQGLRFIIVYWGDNGILERKMEELLKYIGVLIGSWKLETSFPLLWVAPNSVPYSFRLLSSRKKEDYDFRISCPFSCEFLTFLHLHDYCLTIFRVLSLLSFLICLSMSQPASVADSFSDSLVFSNLRSRLAVDTANTPQDWGLGFRVWGVGLRV